MWKILWHAPRICSKICEHIIVSQTMHHQDAHPILGDQQNKFRPRRSCQTQLITTHDLASFLIWKSQADVALLDFVQAFNKVLRHRILPKLRHYNIDSNVIDLSTSFLSNKLVMDGYDIFDVIKWKHFSRYWPFVRGIHRSPVNSLHKGQWREALVFYLICV